MRPRNTRNGGEPRNTRKEESETRTARITPTPTDGEPRNARNTRKDGEPPSTRSEGEAVEGHADGGERREVEVAPEQEGERLDAFLAAALPGRSRSQLQKLIKDGHVRRKTGRREDGRREDGKTDDGKTGRRTTGRRTTERRTMGNG